MPRKLRTNRISIQSQYSSQCQNCQKPPSDKPTDQESLAAHQSRGIVGPFSKLITRNVTISSCKNFIRHWRQSIYDRAPRDSANDLQSARTHPGCRLKFGPHRTRQRCFGPVCDRPSASRPVPSRQNRLQAPLEAVLTGRNGLGRVRTIANRAETALTGAVRTGLNPSRLPPFTALLLAGRAVSQA